MTRHQPRPTVKGLCALMLELHDFFSYGVLAESFPG
jgi:hypothetical protein